MAVEVCPRCFKTKGYTQKATCVVRKDNDGVEYFWCVECWKQDLERKEIDRQRKRASSFTAMVIRWLGFELVQPK